MQTKLITQKIEVDSEIGVWLNLLEGKVTAFLDESNDAEFDLIELLKEEIEEHASSNYADEEDYKIEWLDDVIGKLTKYRKWVLEHKKTNANP